MALGEIGLFNPAESTYMKPGAYDEALRGIAFKQASYLSAMDSFYEQLDETVREFNATLSFKETELAQTKALTEEQIGLSSRQLDIQSEQFKSDLALRQQALKEQTAYQTGMLAVENKKINIASGTNQLGGKSESDKAFEFLNKYMTGGSAGTAAQTSTAAKTGTYGESVSYRGAPVSGQVDYGNINESTWL